MSAEPVAAALEAPAGVVRAGGPPRALRVLAPAVYLLALGTTIATIGLPLARDQLFMWMALGVAACSVSAWRSWGALVVEWLPFLALLVLYDKLRGAVAVGAAQAHVIPQIDVDRWLGGGTLPTEWLQRHLWHGAGLRWWDVAVWAVYMTHFFAVWITAAVLWHRSRARFRRFAVLIVTLTLSAFLIYWLYPAQPPWLAADLGRISPLTRIVPQVWGELGVRTVQSVYEDNSLVNEVAAVPSLHAAYPMMLLLFFWPAGLRVRLGLGLYTLAMAFALVYAGEHFVADILAGWLLAGLVFVVVGAARVPAGRAWRALTSRRSSAAPTPAGGSSP